ncbi:hypothetical protein Goshw_015643 [Gossypium schwendimanii]|uniref:40S ribosomal protein S3a n=1 Tax=Gossypium schwendimanii TaxID=34291 RepID=A0A7J9LA81_GOSSC|nr:hypothetical protein [Gossypium schwendimanii]
MAVGYSFLNLPLLTQMGFASFLESHLFRVVMQEEQEDFQRKERRKEEGLLGFSVRADPFAKKDWYDIKAPSVFTSRNVGKTLVTRTQGTKRGFVEEDAIIAALLKNLKLVIASLGLKHRVFEVSLADLQGGDEDHAYRKICSRKECFDQLLGMINIDIFICVINFSVASRNKLTNIQGMNFTTDKLRFTKRRPNQVKRTCYAQSSQIRQLTATSCYLKELVQKFIPETIGKEIEKATSSIYPLQNVFIRQVKILKAPKFDLGKFMVITLKMLGVKIERPADETMAEPTPELIGA